MGKRSKHDSESESIISDSDSLADEIAPKVKKLHKSKKKIKKHVAKREKRAIRVSDDGDEHHVKKHKHKRKKNKRPEEDGSPVAKKHRKKHVEKKIDEVDIENNASPLEEKQEERDPASDKADAVFENAKNKVDTALLDLERQKALIQAELLRSGNGEYDEVSDLGNDGMPISLNDENGSNETVTLTENQTVKLEKKSNKKKKKKERSRSREKSKSKKQNPTLSQATTQEKKKPSDDFNKTSKSR